LAGSKSLTIVIPSDVHADLKDLAKESDTTMAQIVTEALDAHIPTTRRKMIENTRRVIAAGMTP
jgi:predicted transcriptional regulator